MRNVNQEVWGILSKEISIQKDLKRGIINIRGLAKLLIKEHKLCASLDSVINSINRFEPTIKLQEEKVLSVLKGAKVMTRNNISSVSVKSSLSLNKLFSHEWFEGCFLSETANVTNILAEADKMSSVIALLNQKDIITEKKNLSEIKIVMGDEAIKTKGTLAKMVNELYALNINLEEMVVSVPEFVIYVKDDDFIKAHEAIVTLTKEKNKKKELV